MASLAVVRHMMPATTLAVWTGTALASGAHADGRLALGVGVLALFWLVEWLGISGTFENRVPRHPILVITRALWLVALVVSVVDAFGARWTRWDGVPVRAAGVGLALSGIALRLWSMRSLARAFSYDLKVSDGQELVRRGPYRWLRHPAYTGMLLFSLSLGLWNPSLPGLALLTASTVPMIAYRIGVEEKLLAEHFGARWEAHARATARLVPGIW